MAVVIVRAPSRARHSRQCTRVESHPTSGDRTRTFPHGLSTFSSPRRAPEPGQTTSPEEGFQHTTQQNKQRYDFPKIFRFLLSNLFPGRFRTLSLFWFAVVDIFFY